MPGQMIPLSFALGPGVTRAGSIAGISSPGGGELGSGVLLTGLMRYVSRWERLCGCCQPMHSGAVGQVTCCLGWDCSRDHCHHLEQPDDGVHARPCSELGCESLDGMVRTDQGWHR